MVSCCWSMQDGSTIFFESLIHLSLHKNGSSFSLFGHNTHCVKSIRIRSFSGPRFSAFRLNTEIYSVNLRIHSKCGKMQTRKTSNTDTFYALILPYFLLKTWFDIGRKVIFLQKICAPDFTNLAGKFVL